MNEVGKRIFVNVCATSDAAQVTGNDFATGGFDLGWITIILAGIVFLYFIIAAILKNRHVLMRVGLSVTGGVVIASVVIFCLHTSAVSVIGFAMAALDLILFVFLNLKREGVKDQDK